MAAELIPIIAAIAPAAAAILNKLTMMKGDVNDGDIPVILLAYIIEQNEKSTKALNSMVRAQNKVAGSLKELRVEMIRKEVI